MTLFGLQVWLNSLIYCGLVDTHILSGGSYASGKNVRLKTTEFIHLQSGSTPGPHIPVMDGSMGVRGHCLVKLNSSRAILISGEGFGRTTAIFDFDDQSWTFGPDLNYGRGWHSCGLITDNANNRILAVAGGLQSRSTEMWTLDQSSDSRWIMGPNLPVSVSGASGVVLHDRYLILVGGHSEIMFKLDCFSGVSHCEWCQMEQELEHKKYLGSALLIPDTMAVCLQNDDDYK